MNYLMPLTIGGADMATSLALLGKNLQDIPSTSFRKIYFLKTTPKGSRFLVDPDPSLRFARRRAQMDKDQEENVCASYSRSTFCICKEASSVDSRAYHTQNSPNNIERLSKDRPAGGRSSK
jgi:hypothetical protein